MRRIWIANLTLWVAVSAAGAKELPALDALTEAEATPRTASRLGVPTFVWGTRSGGDERFRAAMRRMSPEQAARSHLGRLAQVYRLAPEVVATVPASVRAPASGEGPILVTFWQEVEGAVVFRDSLKV